MDILAVVRYLECPNNTNMKLQFLHICFFGAVCALLPSCASGPAVSVKTDYNHQVSFADYHTYSLNLSEAPELRPTGQAALTESLKSSLAARGINEAPAGKADLLVVPIVSTQEKLHMMPTRNKTYVLSHRGYGAGTWYINNDVSQYTEGTLVLDFLDRKRRMIVFRGIGQGVISTSERNAAGIREAVQRIVADLPH
jgi:hypothetical protein